MIASDYFQMAKAGAERFRDQVVDEGRYNRVVVRITILGPDHQSRVYGGEEVYRNCEADVFADGVLTITNKDYGRMTMGEFQPVRWIDVTVFRADGHIDYHLVPSVPERQTA